MACLSNRDAVINNIICLMSAISSAFCGAVLVIYSDLRDTNFSICSSLSPSFSAQGWQQSISPPGPGGGASSFTNTISSGGPSTVSDCALADRVVREKLAKTIVEAVKPRNIFLSSIIVNLRGY